MHSGSLNRRQVLRLIAAAGICGLAACHARPRSARETGADALKALEQASGGRLGVFALDTGNGRALSWRADERFALCSTFKLLLAGLVLQDIDSGRIDPQALIAVSADDLVPYAPIVQARLDAGVTAMTVTELAHAAQVSSDNVAANLLLRELGGPPAITTRLRAMGDTHTRLDRFEPELNLVPADEIRDTTTPRAMALTSAQLLTGDVLRLSSRQTLADWLVETRTGLRRLRAGLPREWRVGDKTGTGIAPVMVNKHNDVAVAWPPSRDPIVIACYFEADGHHPEPRAKDDAVFVDVARIVAAWFA
jgi:beta-lactamase class A